MSCEISYVIGLAASVDEDAAKEAKHELRIKEHEIAGLKEEIARTKVSKEKPFWHCTTCEKWSSEYNMCGLRIMDMDPKPEGAP